MSKSSTSVIPTTRMLTQLLSALRLDLSSKKEMSFAFSAKLPLAGWVAFSVRAAVPLFLLEARESRATQIYSFASGINKEAFLLVANLGDRLALVIRSPGREGDQHLRLVVQDEETLDRVTVAFRRLDVISDALSAHASLSDAVDRLRSGAERHFVNLGLFSNYFLSQRMDSLLSDRRRQVDSEVKTFFRELDEEISTEPGDALKILGALGFTSKPMTPGEPTEYRLHSGSQKLDVICVTSRAVALDTKQSDEVVPSFQAITALKYASWVILTNGKLWRLYCGRVSSPSTNYFEIDLEGVADEEDPRLKYFVSLYSSRSFIPRVEGTDIDAIHQGGLSYAREIEDQLRSKVFDGQLFLNLVRAVLPLSSGKKYSEAQLEEAKATALRLLYRILFILYAESRQLLPLKNERYDEISLQRIRRELNDYAKRPSETTLWKALGILFRSIEGGNVEAGVPEYDGELFRESKGLESHRKLENKYLAPALRELTESEGKGIDYQNLGVRHLGSLYEGLLEYSVRQAETDLVVYKDGTLDASYAADIKAKPKPFVSKGDLYLSAAGLARKETGSYFTPDEIVKFLVTEGLRPILESRQRRFEDHIRQLNSKKQRDEELEMVTIDDLLGTRVVDPAMGSGHFLVAAVDQITNWIIGVLKEHPEAPLARMIDEFREEILSNQRKKGIELNTGLLTDSIILKRLVMKECVYGVDINPLAVELAKVSLWLDSFTIGTPLTFLDYNVRTGDSLIGSWIEEVSKRPGTDTLDNWIQNISESGSTLVRTVSSSADLTKDQVEQSREAYAELREKNKPLHLVLDVACAGAVDEALAAKLPRNLPLIEKLSREGGKKPDWWGTVQRGLQLAEKYHAFHWELEFPDVFGSDPERGFDLVIMNPPWEAVKPEDDDFFSMYDPLFRRIESKPEKLKIMKKLLNDAEIKKQYEEYKTVITQHVHFYKDSGQYIKRGTGDTNLWKLFLERALRLQAKGGSLAIVIPSGIVTDEGAKQLREELFKNRIRLLYEFENTEGIFDIHRSYKFVLLVVDKAEEPAQTFKAAFYLHKLDSLSGRAELEKFVDLPVQLIRTSAPESLSIPEVRNKDALDVFTKLYASHPLLSDDQKGWTVSLLTELHRTGDSDLFRTDGKGWPLIEGACFHQFIPDFEKPIFTVDEKAGLQRTARHREYHHNNERIHQSVRLGFRSVASSTNVRSVIACLLPPKSFSPHSVTMVVPSVNGSTPAAQEYVALVSYLAAIFNSYVFDFLIRTRVSMNLSFFYIYQTPVPSRFDDDLSARIIELSARLSAAGKRFESLRAKAGGEIGLLKMKDRIELTAELNALVAKHYGVTKGELEVILNSFVGFKEDDNLSKLEGEIKWDDERIRKFNGEVRKRVLHYFDCLASDATS